MNGWDSSKLFKSESFEQISSQHQSEISPKTDSKTLFIGKSTGEIEEEKTQTKEEKNSKKVTKKKKTATDIHLEIKYILEKDADYSGYTHARSVLNNYLQQGYKGKRLAKWKLHIDEYFTYLEETQIEMANSVNSMWKKHHKKVLQTKEESVKEQVNKKEENEEMVDIDIPDIPEMDDVQAEDPSVEDESGGAVVWGILGGGQAGGRLAESFYNLGYKKCLTVNTAQHDLDGLSTIPDSQKILMDTSDGGGAGKDMRKGEAAADNHQQEIYEKMQTVFGSVDRILICVGAGGGSGGGSCLRLVETAKKYLSYLGKEDINTRVGVLTTLPTNGEASSPVVAANAHLLVSKLCEFADPEQEGGPLLSPLILFDNEKIKSLYAKLTVKQFYPTVNSTVTGLFHMFNVLASQSSDFISFDPADYSRVLSAGGCMIMGVTTLKEYADGSNVSKAIRQNLEKGLLCGGFDISTAVAGACIATASSDILENTPGLMVSLETGFDTLASITGNATVFRGIYQVNKDKLQTYTAVTGLAKPSKRLEDFEKRSSNVVTKKKLYE